MPKFKSESRLLYFNALFDLNLGEHKTERLKRATDEMSLLFLPFGRENDSVIIKVGIEDHYLDYLKECGLTVPQIANKKTITGEKTIGEPWGWDKDAVATFSSMGALRAGPSLESVKMVNSRSFCNALSLDLNCGVPGSKFISNYVQFQNLIKRGAQNFPAVIKPAFGSSGYGFVHLKTPVINKELSLRLEKMINKGGAIIEPWYRRVADISSTFEIDSAGAVIRKNHYQCSVNSKGTFSGVYLPPQGYECYEEYELQLSEIVDKVSSRLFNAGYFGPAGIDSFIYKRDDDEEQLAAVIEINARHVISDIARSIQEKVASHKHCFFRLASSKKVILPENYPELIKKLGQLSYSPVNKKGVIVITPLRVGTKNMIQPFRSAFFLCADSKDDLFRLDSKVIKLLSRA
ncbi:hypothetical protein QA601_11935 [Chitinispirillales bacterium ANBcel5]|uniref:hypothetical protein n=1 Tax=Cellulosispirillum alkaliphilum TaxID=3039283 RepID=UPI002A560888|nr:hypothetical protein [Chitinispirillales bacterium ANBcel5]